MRARKVDAQISVMKGLNDADDAGKKDQAFKFRHPSRVLFDSSYPIRCKAFDRLKKYSKIRMKKRSLNFTVT